MSHDNYLLAIIRLKIELSEQEEEHNSVHSDPPHESSWIVTIWSCQKLEGVNEDENELNLKRGKSISG